MERMIRSIALCLSTLLLLTFNTDRALCANKKETEAQEEEKTIDIDLTALSSIMAYAQITNIVESPGKYRGKTVKMEGTYSFFRNENTQRDYFTCYIQDATLCCVQGIDFELTEEYKYPEDYPEQGEEISIVGVFDTYMEGTFQYLILREAELI